MCVNVLNGCKLLSVPATTYMGRLRRRVTNIVRCYRRVLEGIGILLAFCLSETVEILSRNQQGAPRFNAITSPETGN